MPFHWIFQELIKGENVTDDDDDEQEFDSWEPDPVDANPSECFLVCQIM